MNHRFKIGLRFKPRGKEYWCEIVDVHTTINAQGEAVKVRYVATHEMCGQTIIDNDVVETTIARAEKEGRQ